MEIKWKGEKSREIREGNKIIYLGKNCKRNGVGLIVDEEMKSKVTDIVRKSDKVMVVKLMIEKNSWM